MAPLVILSEFTGLLDLETNRWCNVEMDPNLIRKIVAYSNFSRRVPPLFRRKHFTFTTPVHLPACSPRKEVSGKQLTDQIAVALLGHPDLPSLQKGSRDLQ
jgi:hypothetical protein